MKQFLPILKNNRVLLLAVTGILLVTFTKESLAQTTQTFTSSGSFTVPAGATSIKVECWGAGGAGGGSTINHSGGSGGGGGGYTAHVLTVTPGQVISYTVGTRGTGSSGSDGTAGTASSFLTLTANGGGGGDADKGTAGAGGSATGGVINTTGGSGSIGSNKGGDGGNGANGGDGGSGGSNANGTSGTAPGGGGGGGEAFGLIPYSGGNGAVGQIKVTYLPSITGTTTVCAGSTTTLANTVSGGTWSSGTTSVATVNSSGVVTGVSKGTSVITYSVESNISGYYLTVTTTVTVQQSVGGTISGTTPICLGDAVSLTLSGYTGTILRWERNINSAGWENTGGGTNPTFSETPTSSGTWQYRAVVQDGSCSEAYSEVYAVTVQQSVGGTISGTSAICLNNTVSLTLSGYTGTIIRWERNINSAGWVNTWGGTNPTFSEAPYSSGTWQYRVAVQEGSCSEAYSEVFSVTVSPTTVGGWMSTSSSNSVCVGSSIGTLTLNGSTGDILRWEKRVDSGSWINISNTATTYTEVPASAGEWEYRALVQSGACSSAYSGTVSRTVVSSGDISLGENPSICRGTSSASLPYSVTEGSPTSYSIDFDAAANAAGLGDITGWSLSGSPLSINVPWNIAAGTYNGSLTVGTSGCYGSPLSFTITVNPEPTLTGVSLSSSACVGSGAAISLAGLVPNSTSTIEYSINDVSQTPVTGVVADGSGIAGFTSADLTLADDGKTLKVTGITITNATPNCSSSFSTGNSCTVSVLDLPGAAGSITGYQVVSPEQSNVSYSVIPVSSATSYEWEYSGTGITINNGTTNSINIDFASDATSGNLTVRGINSCGNGTVSANLPITVVSPTVSFTTSSQSASESSGTMVITVQLSEAITTTVSVPFTLSGTATENTDYTITSSPVTIAAGSTTATITIGITDDALDEDDETVIVTMGDPSYATRGAITVHTATITDNDATPTVTFTSASQASIAESGTMTITAQLSAVSGKSVTVPFTVSGTATGGGIDYTITSSPVTIAAESTTGTITITIVSDDFYEGNETVIVTMGTPTNATQGTITVHTATITEDDSAPTTMWYKADTGTSSTTNGSGVSTWSDQATGSNDATSQNTAPVYQTLGFNFNPTINFSAGYYLTASNGISDDMTFFAVYSSTQSTGSTSFWNTPAIIGGETASKQNDYTLSTNYGALYFKGTAGNNFGAETSGTYDDGYPRIVSVTRKMSSSGYIYLYVNGEQAASASSDDNSLSDPVQLGIGNHYSYVSSAQFVGNISEIYGAETVYPAVDRQKFESYLAVKYGITLGNTSNPIDYLSGTGTTVWAGSSTYQNDVAGLGKDNTYGLDQKVSASVNTSSGTSSRVVMANDNDYTSTNLSGRTSLSNGQYLIWGHDAGATGSWSADGIYDRVARTWRVQNTGSVGQVYLQINLTSYPSLPSGRTLKLLVDDNGTLSDGGTTGYTLTNSSGNLYTATVTFPSGTSYFTIGYEAVIPAVSLSVSPASIAEDGGVATFTATLSEATTRNVTVNLTFSGTATDGTDYTASGSTITVTAGNTTGTITVTGINDYTTENNETVIADINTVTNGTEDGTQQATATIIDDDSPGITVNPTSGLVTTESGGTATFTVKLNTQPTASVTITLSSGDTSEGTVSPTSLTFTTSNWNTAQTVTVTGVDDSAFDGDIDYTIITGTASSSDTDYNGTDPSDVSVTNTDNECITSQPSDATACAQGSASFSVGVSGSPSYRWQVSTNSGTSWSNITAAGTSPVYSGYTSATLSLSSIASSNNGYQYRCVLSGSCSETSDVATLSVGHIDIKYTLIASPDLISSGESSTLTLSGSQVGVSYQLQTVADNANVGSAVAGTGGAITLGSVSPTTSTQYCVLATIANGSCASVQITDTRTVIVNTSGMIIDLNPCNGQPGLNFFTNSEFKTVSENTYQIPDQTAYPGVVLGSPLGSYTDYTYGLVTSTNDPLPDGHYVIANSTKGMYCSPQNTTDLWIDTYDNTQKDGTGHMYIVNASFDPGEFYAETLTGLCENTKYEFSADIINLYASNWVPNGTDYETWFNQNSQNDYYTILPNIDFMLNGQIALNTGNIMNDGSWHSYGFTFRTGTGQTSVTLSMRNNSEGGYGNDLALDNIVMRSCGPVIDVEVETSLPVCSGVPVTMKAVLVATDYESPVYQWQVSTDDGDSWSDISGATDSIYTSSDPQYGEQYRFVVGETEANLSNSKCYVASDPVTITTVAGITSTTPGSVCGSGTVTLEAEATPGSTISWYDAPTGGTLLQSGSTPSTYTTPTISTTTTYYVEAVNGECGTTERTPVVATVNSTVTASVSISSSVGSSVCSGTNVTFTATPTNGGSSPTYQWKMNGSDISGATSQTYTKSITTGQTITCVMTSSLSSCVTGSPATSNAITMTVGTNLTPSVTIVADPGNTVCTGTSVTFTATPVNGGAIPTYQWKKNGTSISGAVSNIYTSSSLVTGDVITCVMTTSLSCTTSSTATSGTITMTVNPNNTITLSSASGTDSQTLCINTAITDITYTTTEATGATFSGLPTGVTGSWSSNTVTISGTPTASGTFNYTVTLTGGCGTVTATGTITVNPASVGGSIDGSAEVCYGTNSTFLTLSGNTGTVVKWQYSTDSGTTWNDISNTATTYTATDLTVTTQYRAVVQSGVCNVAYSSVATVTMDYTDPVISGCPSNITVNSETGQCSANVSWTEPTASDNCGIQSFTSDHTPGESFATGTTTVTYTATDTNGKTATCSFTVTVNDNQDPVFTTGFPADITVSTLGNVPDPIADTDENRTAVASDNCGLSSLTSDDVTSLTCPRTITRTYTITDINGRYTTRSQTITVTDAPCIENSLCDGSKSTDLITGTPIPGTGTLYSQNITVCSSTTYEVELTGVSGTSPFNFDVILGSDVVNSSAMYNSGSTYGFKFKTGPSATTVALELRNNDVNPLTVSAISFAHCGPGVSVALTTEPECLGTLAEITATVTGSGTYVYQWQESSDSGSSWSNLTNGSAVSGATSAVLSFTSWSKTKIYRVVVSETTAGLDDTDCSIRSGTVSITPTDTSAPVYQEAFKNGIDPVHTGGNYTYTVCNDGTNKFTFLALDGTDLIDHCTAFENLIKTYSITNGTNDITNETGDASNYSFPVGSSTVVYRAEDEDGFVSSFTFTVVVNENPTITTITTEGTISEDGSGYRPYQGSTHTYTVDGGTATTGSTYTWKVLDKDNSELSAGNANTYSIDTTNPAAAVITWGASIPISGDNYTIVVTKTNSSNCSAEAQLSVTILENTFNATVVDAGNECQAGESGTTLTSWTINKTGGADNWIFDYVIKVGETEVYSASAYPASGSTVSISYPVSNEAGVDKTYTFIISNVYTDFNTPETDITDDSDTVTLWGVPNTSEIQTD